MRKTVQTTKRLLRSKRSRSNGATPKNLDYAKIEAARGILVKKKAKVLHFTAAIRAKWH